MTNDNSDWDFIRSSLKNVVADDFADSAMGLYRYMNRHQLAYNCSFGALTSSRVDRFPLRNHLGVYRGGDRFDDRTPDKKKRKKAKSRFKDRAKIAKKSKKVKKGTGIFLSTKSFDRFNGRATVDIWGVRIHSRGTDTTFSSNVTSENLFAKGRLPQFRKDALKHAMEMIISVTEVLWSIRTGTGFQSDKVLLSAENPSKSLLAAAEGFIDSGSMEWFEKIPFNRIVPDTHSFNRFVDKANQRAGYPLHLSSLPHDRWYEKRNK